MGVRRPERARLRGSRQDRGGANEYSFQAWLPLAIVTGEVALMRHAPRFGAGLLVSSLLAALSSTYATEARAQADAAAAQALWEQGKTLLEQGRVVEACAKLGESYRLDPGTGALLLLANCHEKEGKLASAWAELNEAAARARKEGGGEREVFAREQAAALAPRLSRLRLEVAPTTRALAGLRVERNGVETRPAAFGDSIPVDGGSYRLSATAPGRVPWETTVAVKAESDLVAVLVPALPLAPVAAAARGAAGAASSAASGLTLTQKGGLVTAGVGGVGLALAGVFTFVSLDKKSQAEAAGCKGNQCPPEGATLQRSAVSSADAATVSVIAGGVLLGAGATLFILGRRPEREAAPELGFDWGPGRASLNVTGAF